MSQQGNLLWCCHVRGPDDVYAAADYEFARRMADELNYCLAPHRGIARNANEAFIFAAPMLWPYSAESWAKNLIGQMGEIVAYHAEHCKPVWERDAEARIKEPRHDRR